MATEFTFDENTVSDLHKDAFGFRPSGGFWEMWAQATDAEKQAEWDSLLVSLERSILRDKEEEQYALKMFNQLVDNTIASGAKGREQAIKWLMDADEMYANDVGYFEWSHGIPYGTVNGKKWG